MTRTKTLIALPQRLRDQVYARLRDEISSGAFPVGHRFIELDLAARYGVSRTPIREALLQLAREGLLSQDRGFTLPVDSRKDVVDRLEVRLLLDAQVARHAATDRDEAGLKILRKALERARKAHEAGRHRAFVSGHQDVRDQIRALCGNRLLARHAEMLDESFRSARDRLHETQENRALSLASDERLVAAIEAGDPAEAEREIRAFVDAVREFYTSRADAQIDAA